MAIPLTLAITVLLMRLFRQTFNLMTLGAMAIAIGLVIDDAVVITENIVRHLRFTAKRSTAVRNAVQELIGPVTSSTITTVVVFLPLGLLQGVSGQFFTALSLTLTISVLVSFVLALTIIPLLSDQFLKDGTRQADTSMWSVNAVGPEATASGPLARIGRALDALAERYARVLGSALSHAGVTLVAALFLVAAGVGVYRLLGTGFLPEMDEGSFVVDVVTPGGTALAETDRQLHIIEGILARIPEVTGTSRRTGAELGLFATEQNKSDIVAKLKPNSQRDRYITDIMEEVRGSVEKAVPRARAEFIQILSDVLDDLSGASSPMEIKLFGPDLAALEAYATALSDPIGKIDGLEDFYNGIAEPSAEMSMSVRSAA